MHCITWSSHYAAGLCRCKWRLDLIHTAGTVRKESRLQVNNPLIVYILLLDLGAPRWATVSLVLILVRPHGSSSDDCDSPVYILLLYCSISFRIIHLLQSSLYNTPSSGNITKKNGFVETLGTFSTLLSTDEQYHVIYIIIKPD